MHEVVARVAIVWRIALAARDGDAAACSRGCPSGPGDDEAPHLRSLSRRTRTEASG